MMLTAYSGLCLIPHVVCCTRVISVSRALPCLTSRDMSVVLALLFATNVIVAVANLQRTCARYTTSHGTGKKATCNRCKVGENWHGAMSTMLTARMFSW